MERAIPIMVAAVAAELPDAARNAGVDSTAAELSWLLTAVAERPDSDAEVENWWRRQRH
jgi:hypothetical protein